MFEDLEELDHVDVSVDSPDRTIAYAIWAKSESLNVSPEEGWAIFFERYPSEPRFLLLNGYSELAEGVNGAWTADYFLKKVERILNNANGALDEHVRELVGYGSAILASAKGDDAKRLAEIRARLGVEASTKRDDRAGLKLRRYEREVLREIDEKTKDGEPFGERAPAATTTTAWETAMTDSTKEKKPYAATAKLERGDLVTHPKFGVGVVTATEPGRATILFESGPRKLVSA